MTVTGRLFVEVVDESVEKLERAGGIALIGVGLTL
jgi:hypothetical protein